MHANLPSSLKLRILFIWGALQLWSVQGERGQVGISRRPWPGLELGSGPSLVRILETSSGILGPALEIPCLLAAGLWEEKVEEKQVKQRK